MATLIVLLVIGLVIGGIGVYMKISPSMRKRIFLWYLGST
jgi:hypothetical protein